ncbi:MAG: nitroreductase family protein [Candidatus Woesearchaeota archaeon]
MELSEAIKRRRSIKRYLDQPVEWSKLGAILDSGRLAPSAGNLQPWKFIVVTNKDKIKKISEACYQQYWMQTAPVHVIICAEINKMNRFYGIRGERLYSIQSCALAAQNIMLETINQGLACCFVSAFDEEMISRTFQIPSLGRPQAIITIGYAGEEKPEPPKYTLNDIVHIESFGNKIRDFEKYIGYGSGRDIKNFIMKSKDKLDNATYKSENFIKKIANKINKNKKI